MNRVEKLIYDLVKDNPRLKSRIVKAYQAVCAIVPQRSLVSTYPVSVRDGYFYGFHDKTPFSADNSRLLAHRSLIGDVHVCAGDTAEVGFFEGHGWSDFRALGTTSAWDWQLGSMLQWRGKSSEQIAFNDIVAGRIGARIVTTSGKSLAALPFPVVHVSPDGLLASTYCFRRVGRAMPGYGVRFDRDDGVPMHAFSCEDSAAFRVMRLEDGAEVFSVGLEQVSRIDPHPSMEGAFHYFHHSLFSPSGRRLFFLHRWVDRNERRWTRMFGCDADGGNLHLFPTHEMVSHIGWIDDDNVLAYARTSEHGDGYYIFPWHQKRYTRVAQRFFNSDGHPMKSPVGDYFVTDSYPDRFRNQGLWLYSWRRDEAIKLARINLPRRFAEDLQVDLHPRFDRSGTTICFDSGHTSTRSLCTIGVPVLAE